MKRIAAAIAFAVVFAFGTASAVADTASDCQAKSKKKLNDPGASLVNLTPVSTTVSHLVSLHVSPTTGGARSTVEKTTYRVHATIVAVKLEVDRDLHVVIRDGTHTMITEAPDPACAVGSRVLTQIRAVRSALLAKFGSGILAPLPHGAPHIVSVPATLTGVGFVDTVHGQYGVAPNGIELHPLTAISFGTARAASADATATQFRTYLRSTYGVRNPRYARCPRAQRFSGQALCEAQFRRRHRRRGWRFVSVSLRRGRVAHKFTRTWTRRWRTCRRRTRSAPGRLRSNMGSCDLLMAADIQHSVQFQRRWPRTAGIHGTNTAGFEPRVVFRCRRVRRTARCTNSLGDSFRYTPR